MDNPPGPSVSAELEGRGGRQLSPSEGWTAPIALLVLMLAVAFAVDDAVWAGYVRGSRVSQTHFLPLAVVLSVVVGFVLVKSKLGRLATHLLGAAIGTVFLLVSISSVISSSPSFETRLRAISVSLGRFYHDAFELGIRSSETTVFLLIMGMLLWAAGQFAAYAVFRHRRPLPALIVPGAILLANMAITVRAQYLHLIVFAAAALILAVRLNLTGQREGWRERRIVDGGQLGGLFMRSGAIFVALTLGGSILLAANASSAPLARAWRDVDNRLYDLGIQVNRMIGGISGAARGPNNIFTSSHTIGEFWQSSNQPVFTATTSDGEGYYWRAGTFDSFDGLGWDQLGRQTRRVNPGVDLLAGTADGVTGRGSRREVRMTVTAIDVGDNTLFAPETPYQVDRAVSLETQGDIGPFFHAELESDLNEGESYTVSALVLNDTGPNAVTAKHLAAASTRYEPWAERYTEIREGSIGPTVYETAAAVVAALPEDQRDPYHVADAIQRYLWQDGGFTYDTDVRGMCAGELLVDCFLANKTGFCEHFATTMVMMLRTQGIPARYVTGYLPGHPFAEQSWQVEASAAHAWVEVFFPTFGWIRFDPTPGNTDNGQVPTILSAGEGPARTRPPRIDRDFPGMGELICAEDFCPSPGATPGAAPAGTTTGGQPPDLLAPIALVLLLLAIAALLVATAIRRIPNVQPEQAYRGVERIARRFGHGARPSQTAYEYAADLAELVPRVRGELQVVATAKVQATYAARGPELEVVELMRRAYRRARLGLLRLVLRRPRLGRSPRAIGPK